MHGRAGHRHTAVFTAALAAAVAIPSSAAAQEPVDTLTLDEVVARAIRHSPQVAQSRLGIRNAEIDRRSTVGSFLPSLSFSSGASLASTERFNPQTNTTVSGSNDSYSARLNTGVELFTGGRRFAELRSARSSMDAAQASLVETQYQVALNAKQTFFGVLRADELIRVAGAGVERAQEGLTAAQRRLDVGSATRSDVLRSRLEVANAEQTRLQARNQKRTATYALGRLVGVDGAVEARLTEPLAVRPLQLAPDALLEEVVARSPAVTAALADVQAGDAGVSAARAQYFPSLRASGSVDWFNQDPTFDGGRTGWSVGLGLSYPIFNGFQRDGTVDRAQAQAVVAQARLEDARRAGRAELERLLGDIALQAERVELLTEAVAVATEDLRVQEERYRLGASTILDRITSQVSLIQAEIDLVGARYDYRLALAELEALLGREL